MDIRRHVVVNVGRIQQAIDEGALDPKATIDAAALKAAGFFKNPRDGVRLLAKGEIKAKVTVEVTGASKAAIEAVEKAGGSVALKAKPEPKAEAPA